MSLFDYYNEPNRNERFWLLKIIDWATGQQNKFQELGIAKFNSFAPADPSKLPQPEIPPADATPANYQVWVQDEKAKSVDTQIGSQVEDPYLDRLRQRASSADVQERASFYDQIDLLYVNCPELHKAQENLIEGAMRSDKEQMVEPSDDFLDVPLAKEMAANANRLYREAKRHISVDIEIRRLKEYLKYGNLFVQKISNEYGVLVKTRALPTKTIKIASNQQLEFLPGQDSAYQQFTRDIWSHPVAWFPESAIIPLLNKQYESDRYGWPHCLPALSYVRALIRGTGVLGDARDAGMPRVVEIHEDPLGNPVDEYSLVERRYNTTKSKMDRGEQRSAYDHELINGKATMTMLSSNGEFWNAIGDLRWFASGVTAVFNRSLAKQMGESTINRATLDRITENDYEGEYRLALLFAGLHDKQILEGIIALANLGAARSSTYYSGLLEGNTDKLYIDPRMITLTTQVKARRLPERLLAEGNFAINLYNNFLIDPETAIEICARGGEFDPQQVITRLKERGEFGKHIADQKPGSSLTLLKPASKQVL